MAQWSRMNQLFQYLPTQTVTDLYPNSFPIEVRFYLASWIEEQRWEDFDLDKVDLEVQAQFLLEQVIRILHTLAQQKVDVVEKMRLMHVGRNMHVFKKQPLQFGVMVRDILRNEQALLNNATVNMPQYLQSPRSVQSSNPKMQDVDHLVLKVQELQNCRKNIHDGQEQLNLNVTNFESEFQEPSKPNGLDKQNKERQNLQRNIKQQELQLQILAEKRSQLLQEAVDSLDQCQSNLITRLKTWRWEQHKATIGHPFDDNLSPLQTWCETLLVVNLNLRQELVLVGKPMPEHEEMLEHLLRSLLQSCLMADKQPPQVIKTQSKFSTTVRFLLGDKVASGKPVVVKAQIITETQARNLGQLGTVPSENVGELINNTAILEHNQSNKNTCATFRNMSIRKIKRADRKGSESVTEEKFALLFSTEITITGRGTPYKIQTISVPLVIIVHGSQDHNALATIIWDCAFSEPDRMPFVVPERVPWKEMCVTLNSKLMSEVGTCKSLDEYNQHFLAQKIFDKPDISGDYSNMLVSWTQFNKEVLPGRPFTFWQWFEGVMELTKRQLKAYWSDGLIFGFIGKQHLHLILQDRPNGTFLLRFSDSEIGGITIAYVAASENGGQKIQNIQPFTKRDLEIRCLGDRIRDIENITLLYPEFPKNDVFRKYYTDDPSSSSGYIGVLVRTNVAPEAGAASPTASNVMSQDSHQHHYPMEAGAASPAASNVMSQDSHHHHYPMPGFSPFNGNMVGGAESLPDDFNDSGPPMDIDDILETLGSRG